MRLAPLLHLGQGVTPHCEPNCPVSPPRLAGASLLTVACIVAIGCAPLFGRPTQTQIDNPNQVDALTRAQVWQPTNVASMDMRRGPRDRGAFAPNATINCRHMEKDTGGKTPKFACVMGGDELKVKYGRDNGEIYAEVAASRLLWALGFGADRVYPVRVICTGCPESLKADSRGPDGRAVFEYAVVDREIEGYDVPGWEEPGWAWPDLDRVNPAVGGAPKAHRDALTLLAVLLQHTDSKREQQRFICLGPPSNGDTCARPFLMIADVGKTFGKANALNKDEPGSVNLQNWRAETVWRDAPQCVGNLPQSLTGTLHNPVISEEGRRFLAALLVAVDRPADARPVRGGALCGQTFRGDAAPASVQDWVDAFKAKIAEVVNRTCSTVTQAADAR